MERLAHGFGLVEGPVWIPGRGLIFSDVLGGGVHCLADDGTVATVFTALLALPHAWNVTLDC